MRTACTILHYHTLSYTIIHHHTPAYTIIHHTLYSMHHAFIGIVCEGHNIYIPEWVSNMWSEPCKISYTFHIQCCSIVRLPYSRWRFSLRVCNATTHPLAAPSPASITTLWGYPRLSHPLLPSLHITCMIKYVIEFFYVTCYMLLLQQSQQQSQQPNENERCRNLMPNLNFILPSLKFYL